MSKRRAKFGQLIFDACDYSRSGWCCAVSKYYHIARRPEGGTYRIPHSQVRLGVPQPFRFVKFVPE